MDKKEFNQDRCGKSNRRRTGSSYERAAGQYLTEQGYRILKYNYHCRYAEIDIVAEEDGYLVFCEVKYRRGGSDTEALEAVDERKQRRICRGALYYMSEHHMADVPCRFDVVGISGDACLRITLIRNAFDYH